MTNSAPLRGNSPRWRFLVHPTRTAVAAVASLVAAWLVRLPEPYWAPITTLVITQSSLGAALEVSRQRFIGTVLGAVVGTVAATSLGSHPGTTPRLLVFAVGIFILGLMCQVLEWDWSAYRFAGITLAIVLLIPLDRPAWQIAYHRFAGVSIGNAIALLLAWVWPETEPQPRSQP